MATEQALLALLKRQKQSVKKREPLSSVAQKVGVCIGELKNALKSKLTLGAQLKKLRAKMEVQSIVGGKAKKTAVKKKDCGNRAITAAAALRRLPLELRSNISSRTARRVTAPERQRAKRRKAAKKKKNQLHPGTPEYLEASRVRPEYEGSQRYWS